MTTTSDDRALLARSADGDRDAFEELYRRHATWLTARLQSRCGNPELTDIALQDTFVAAWRSARTYRGEGDVGAWLWGIGIRRLIDVLRKRRATPMDPSVIASLGHATSHTSGGAPGFATGTAASNNASLEQLALGGTNGELEVAMRHLPGELRAVLIATAIDGLTTKEAAHLLGVPQGTVKTRLMRARRHMQEALS